MSRGDFQRHLLPAKEKTDPQSPSMAAATTGVPASRAISSKPRLIAINWPDREMLPSGKTRTTSPARNARAAARIPASGPPEETPMQPLC